MDALSKAIAKSWSKAFRHPSNFFRYLLGISGSLVLAFFLCLWLYNVLMDNLVDCLAPEMPRQSGESPYWCLLSIVAWLSGKNVRLYRDGEVMLPHFLPVALVALAIFLVGRLIWQRRRTMKE
jgi:hypothetical protein